MTDSLKFDGSFRPLTNGLGFLQGSHCPHFDDPARRRSYLASVASGALPGGVGVDEHAALHFVAGSVVSAVSGDATATAHLIERDHDGSVTVVPIDADIVSGRSAC